MDIRTRCYGTGTASMAVNSMWHAARLASELEQVDGIGSKTIAKLLREFGSLERVREAPQEELAKVIGPAAARRLHEYYNVSGAAELKVLN